MKKIFLLCIGFASITANPFLVRAQDVLGAFRDSMVLVEGGTFIRGSAEQPYASTESAHEATVSSFLISPTETTQALWRAVMNSNPSAFVGNNRPVERVNWLEAVAFCNALSGMEGLQPAYRREGSSFVWDRDADGYRLPTEAEWEYAARGGIHGALGSEPLRRAPYAGGMDADAVGWFDRNSNKTTQPVARKAPNQLGLYDMSGNVWEWCWDWYGDYPRTAVVDPEGAARGVGQKVLRGGAWFAPMNLLRVTYRYWNLPTFKVNSVGFRIARNAPVPVEEPAAAEPSAQVDFFEALSAPEESAAQ